MAIRGLVLGVAGLSGVASMSVAIAQPATSRQRAGDLFQPFYKHALKPLDEGELAGMEPGSRPPILTWKQVYLLALLDADRRKEGRSGLLTRLDMPALEARAERLGFLDFSKFRVILLGTSELGRTFRDPATRTLELYSQLQGIENARYGVAEVEILLKVFLDLIEGEASGLTRLDLDALSSLLQKRRLELLQRLMRYRQDLDVWKTELGLSPRVPVALDRSVLAGFQEGITRGFQWFGNPARELDELPMLAQRLPTLQNLVIEGRFVTGVRNQPLEARRLAELLSEAADAAIRHRREQKVDRGGSESESEEALELRVREQIRRMTVAHSAYEIQRGNLILLLRQKDQLLEQLIAPPVGQAARTGSIVTSLTGIIDAMVHCQDGLVQSWATYCSARTSISHDLGTLPCADWTSFLEQFVARPTESPGNAVPDLENLELPKAPPAAPAPAAPKGRG